MYYFASVVTTKYHCLGNLNNRICFIFFTVMETESPRSGCWQVWFLRGLLGLQTAPYSLVLTWLSLPGVSLCVQISSSTGHHQSNQIKTHPSCLIFKMITSIKDRLQIQSCPEILGIKISTYVFGGNKIKSTWGF